MVDYAGPLQRLAVSTTLWMPVAPPLLGLAWHVLSRGRAARAVGVGSVVLATAATIAHVVAFERGGRSALLDSIPGGGRIGWTDVGIELWFDAWSEWGFPAACVLALGMGAWLLATRRAAADDARTWAWLQVALAGAFVSLLAGGFATTAIGWTLVAVASVWLAGSADAEIGRAHV